MTTWERLKALKQLMTVVVLIAGAAHSRSEDNKSSSGTDPAQAKPSINEIKIISPKPGDLVSSPLEVNVPVNGKRSAIQEIRYELKNEDGSLIRSFSEHVRGGKDGHYVTSFMHFSCPKGKTGTLEAKIIEYKNGQTAVLASASVPIKFKPETPYVRLYFQNDILLKGYASPGATVFPVERKNLLKKAGPKAAIEELLKGSTEQEKAAGYYSQVWPGTKLQNLQIKKGVIYADFSKELGQCRGGTDCQVPVQAPIAQTLDQFCMDVVMTVDGSEDPLNP